MTSKKQKHGKSKKKKSSNKKELNRKGSEKEGSEYDIFTNNEKATTLTEKNTRAEKVTPLSNSQPVAVNANSNNRSKTNSSQKSENVSSVSLGTKEKVMNSQNIPVASTVPAQLTDINKTENDKLLDNSKAQKKKYSVEFMMELRPKPQCNLSVKVKYLPVMLPTGGSRSMSQNGCDDNFLPFFSSNSSVTSRKSQQGSMRREKPNQIHVSLSLREEVPLRRSEDAWKPTVLANDSKDVTSEEKKTELLYKNTRSILNKLTPEKFPVLINKFQQLELDTMERFNGVIDILFEKAVDEPGFCKWYAAMCQVVQDKKCMEGKDTFRTAVLNKCQKQFENATAAEESFAKERAEIEACTDPEKKKELKLAFEEKEFKTRRKSVGNCRFIGELFKVNLLTVKIMWSACVKFLLNQADEDSLECLCKLLTTIGKDLDEKLPKEMDTTFKRLHELTTASKKKTKLSSRIRFMILDVIDLRKNQWVPRREANNPKTREQINQEMEKRDQDQKLASMTSRKSYDDYSRNRDSRKNRNDNKSDDSWTTATNNKNHMSKPAYKMDREKLELMTTNFSEHEDLTFGRPTNFNNWRQGSSVKQQKSAVNTQVQDRMDCSRSSSVTSTRNTSSSKLTPSSSLEKSKNYTLRDDANKMLRSSSNQSVHQTSREASTDRVIPSRNSSLTAPIRPSNFVDPEKKITSMYLEFNCNPGEETLKDILLEFPTVLKNEEDQQLAIQWLLKRLPEKPKEINDIATVIRGLLKEQVISRQVLLKPLASFLKSINTEDFICDCPKIWEYMVEFISLLPIDEDCALCNEMKSVLERILEPAKYTTVLKDLEAKLKIKVREDRQSIIKFLSEKIDRESYDNITKEIDEKLEEKRYVLDDLVVALTEVICEKVLAKISVKDKNLSKEDGPFSETYCQCCKKYIENKEKLELTCLQTVVDFDRRNQHPQKFVLTMFEELHDKNLISVDAFRQLEEIDFNEKGVVLMQIGTFLKYITSHE